MTIEFHCPACDKLLSTTDERAGWMASCPGCREPVTVPHKSIDPSIAETLDYVPKSRSGADGERQFDKSTASAGQSCPMCGATLDAAAIRCGQCGENLSAQGDPLAKRDFEYASFGRRLVAYLIDYFIAALIPNVALGVLFDVGQFAGNIDDPFDDGIWLGSTAAGILIDWIYHAVMESSSRQATVGKMTMGLIVTDTEGQRISFGRATGRYFAKFLSGMMCCAGYIMAAFTERKQALHDLICGTLVLRA